MIRINLRNSYGLFWIAWALAVVLIFFFGSAAKGAANHKGAPAARHLPGLNRLAINPGLTIVTVEKPAQASQDRTLFSPPPFLRGGLEHPAGQSGDGQRRARGFLPKGKFKLTPHQ